MTVDGLVSSVGSLGGAAGVLSVGRADAGCSPRGDSPPAAQPASRNSTTNPIFVTMTGTRADSPRFRSPRATAPGERTPRAPCVLRGSAELDLHGGSVDADHLDLDADRGELDAVVRQLLVEVLL